MPVWLRLPTWQGYHECTSNEQILGLQIYISILQNLYLFACLLSTSFNSLRSIYKRFDNLIYQQIQINFNPIVLYVPLLPISCSF